MKELAKNRDWLGLTVRFTMICTVTGTIFCILSRLFTPSILSGGFLMACACWLMLAGLAGILASIILLFVRLIVQRRLGVSGWFALLLELAAFAWGMNYARAAAVLSKVSRGIWTLSAAGYETVAQAPKVPGALYFMCFASVIVFILGLESK